jgi:hypothetical protein
MAEHQSIFHDAVKNQTEFRNAYRRIVDDEQEREEKPVNPLPPAVGLMGLWPGVETFVGKWKEAAEPAAAEELQLLIDSFAVEGLGQPVIGYEPLQVDNAMLVGHRVIRALRNEMAHRRQTLAAKPTGRVKYFTRVLDAWGFSRDDAARMLGVSGGYIGRLFLDGKAPLMPGDMTERVNVVAAIAVALDNMYDDDVVVRTWLDQRRTELAGKTPRELLAGGTLDGLFKVQQLVRYEANR